MWINYDNLTRQLLPPHKRLPARLSLFIALTKPLKSLFSSFTPWRTNIRFLLNVNSQVRVLEGYLRWKYGEPFKIKILTYNDLLPQVSLEVEQEFLVVGLLNERHVEVPLLGEVREDFEGVDFIVFTPNCSDEIVSGIKADIEKYKQSLVRYAIKIQNN